MKRVLGTAVLMLALVLAAVPAAGAAVSPTERKLTRQVTTLQRQVTALQRQVRTLQTQMREANNGIEAAIVLAMCDAALTADALQGTWAVLDQVAQATQGRTYFGPQTPLNDSGVCNAFRIPRSNAVPPTVNGFSVMLGLLRGSSAVVSSIRLPS